MKGCESITLTPLSSNIKDAFFDQGKKSYDELFEQRQVVCLSTSYSIGKISSFNPASFPFLNVQQAQVITLEIQQCQEGLLDQLLIDEAEHRAQDRENILFQLDHCKKLLTLLETRKLANTPSIKLKIAVNDSKKPVIYLALREFSQFVVKKIEEFSSGKTIIIKQWIGDINERRLYWVWGGSLLGTIIDLLPAEFYYQPQAASVVSAPQPFTGYLSWILYYFRFGIELGLLLKHTFSGPWMSKEEQSIPISKRFKSQWQHRKFALLNDSIWATLNLLCFFWLKGPGRPGYLGNFFTGVLLLMDLTISIWRFLEEESIFLETKHKYRKEIEYLESMLECVHDEEQRIALTIKLNKLKQIKENFEFDWTYKKYSLINTIVYSGALLAAFSLMCSFYLDFAPELIMVLGVVGAALCFVLTAVYSAIDLDIEITKANAIKNNLAKEFKKLESNFKLEKNDNAKTLLYLDLCQLSARSKHQEHLIHFQKLNFVRSIFVDALIPPLIFVSFMFLPFGFGLATMALGFALISLSKILIKQLDPNNQEVPQPQFNQNHFAFLSKFETFELTDFEQHKLEDKVDYKNEFINPLYDCE